MREIAMIVEGVWLPVTDAHHASVESPTHGDPVDVIVRRLGEIVRLAQTLSEQDQRRVRDFVHAASSALNATTVLPKDDQQLFEATLRNIGTG